MSRKKLNVPISNANNPVEISDDTVSTSDSAQKSSISSLYQRLTKVPKIIGGTNMPKTTPKLKPTLKPKPEAEIKQLLFFIDSDDDLPIEPEDNLFKSSMLSSTKDRESTNQKKNASAPKPTKTRQEAFADIFGPSYEATKSNENPIVHLTPKSKTPANVLTPRSAKDLVLSSYSQDEDVLFGASSDDIGDAKKRKSINSRRDKQINSKRGRIDNNVDDHGFGFPSNSSDVDIGSSKVKTALPRIKKAKRAKISNIIFSDSSDSPTMPEKLIKSKKNIIFSISSSDSDKSTAKPQKAKISNIIFSDSSDSPPLPTKSKGKRKQMDPGPVKPIKNPFEFSDSESSIEIPSVKRNKIKTSQLPSSTPRILRSNFEDPDILSLPESDSALPKHKKKKKRKHKKPESISGESEPDSDLESIISVFSDASTNSILSGPGRELLYCSICQEFQAYDNFSRVEQTEPKYGVGHRFCLRHHGKDNDVVNYAQMIELKAFRQKLKMEEFDKKYRVDYDVSDVVSDSD